uniref:Uncharacterized protein n=1 Tax=viral metagenome TaxID=1070528 RepID=A0A6M3JTR8_9ZZZZ
MKGYVYLVVDGYDGEILGASLSKETATELAYKRLKEDVEYDEEWDELDDSCCYQVEVCPIGCLTGTEVVVSSDELEERCLEEFRAARVVQKKDYWELN